VVALDAALAGAGVLARSVVVGLDVHDGLESASAGRVPPAALRRKSARGGAGPRHGPKEQLQRRLRCRGSREAEPWRSDQPEFVGRRGWKEAEEGPARRDGGRRPRHRRAV
jgi:hypothetical protein